MNSMRQTSRSRACSFTAPRLNLARAKPQAAKPQTRDPTSGLGFGSSASSTKRKKGQDKPDYMTQKSICPCGSGKEFEDCCDTFISREQLPETAEQLMRSRYSAYCKGQASWIVETTHPRSTEFQGGDDQSSALLQEVKETVQSNRFFKLQVLLADGKPGSNEAFVDFRVWYKAIGQKTSGKQAERAPMITMTEKSRFEKENGRWMYMGATLTDRKSHPYPE